MKAVGYTKSWRKEIESDIWKMPPMYQRVFYYLRQTVSWESNIFPTRNGFGIHLNKGQGIFSIQQIIDGVSWYERGVPKKPNKKTILDVLKWLSFNKMIVRESNSSGTFVIICNWYKYQDQQDAKVTEGIPDSIPDSIPESIHTKEVKEVKEEEKRGKKIVRFVPPSRKEVEEYCQARGNGISADRFINFYESNGWMVGKNKMKCWKAAVRTWESRTSTEQKRADEWN